MFNRVLTGITVLGFVLRVYHLDHYGLWIDEGSSYVFAKRNIWSILTNTGETNPPLYYLILHFWMLAFGSSEWVMRFLSVIFSSVAIVLTGRLGKLLYNEQVGLVAALLLSIMAFPIHYAREVRTYSLFLAATAGSFLFFYKSIPGDKKADWSFYVIFTTILCYAHNYWVFLFLGQSIFILIFYAKNKNILIRVLIAQSVVLILFSPWLLVLLKQAQRIGVQGSWLPDATLSVFGSAVYKGVAFFSPEWPYLLIVIPIGILAVLPFTRAHPPRQSRPQLGQYQFSVQQLRNNCLLLVWYLFSVFIPFIISNSGTSIFHSRYTIGAIPAFYLLLANGIWKLPARFLRMGFIVIILAASAINLRYYYKNPAIGFSTEFWREKIYFIKSQLLSGQDVIVIAPGYAKRVFDYYAYGENKGAYAFNPNNYPDDGSIRQWLDTVTSGKKRLWLFSRPGAKSSTLNLLQNVLGSRYKEIPLHAQIPYIDKVPIVVLYDVMVKPS